MLRLNRTFYLHLRIFFDIVLRRYIHLFRVMVVIVQLILQVSVKSFQQHFVKRRQLLLFSELKQCLFNLAKCENPD